MGTVLLLVTLASLALVVWAVIDVAKRPAVALAGKWKALWITGMVGAWFLFGAIGATVSAIYLAGARKRLNTINYFGRH